MRRRFLTPARCLAVMLMTGLACYAGAVALPHDPEIRYQSFKGTMFARTEWIYDRIHHDPAPIDVVFLGSSRTEASMRPTMIEPLLAQRGQDLRVVNFALPATGYDIRETLADEVLRHKRIKLLVIDVTERLPRDGHQAFGDLATAGQILRAPWLVNRNLPHDLLRLPVRQIDLALATLDRQANGYRARFEPADYAGSTADPPNSKPESQDLTVLGSPAHLALLEAQSRRRYRETTPPILPASLGGIEFGVSRTYIERVTAQARRQGVKVAFLFLPFYKGPAAPEEERWLQQFGPVWKADYLRTDPHNYRDSGHTSANAETRASVTRWIAAHISATLREDKHASDLGEHR
jgi:hypothetical protein